MDKKFTLPKEDLDIAADLKFIHNVLKCYGAQVDEGVPRRLLDLAYTLARNRLVEARRFANLTNKKCIDADDVRIAKMEKTDDFQFGPSQLAKRIVQQIGPPAAPASLLLPPWRSCQVGAFAELKQMQAETESNQSKNKVVPPKPPKTRIIPRYNKNNLNL